MGMYDSIYFKCPNCGKKIEAQSKAGDCVLATYTKDNTPLIVAADCLGDVIPCECGKRFEIKTPWVFLPLFIEETTKEKTWFY